MNRVQGETADTLGEDQPNLFVGDLLRRGKDRKLLGMDISIDALLA